MTQHAYQNIKGKAAQLFHDKGYHAASMEDLANAVGIKKGSLYYYVQRKDQLLFEIAEEFPLKYAADLRALSDDTRLSAEQKIRMAIENHFELFETEEGLASSNVFLLEYKALPDMYRDKILEQRQQYEDAFRQLITKGIEQGEFSKIDAGMAARAILGMCNWATQWYSTEGKRSAAEIASVFADLVLKGLLVGRDSDTRDSEPRTV